MNLTIHTKQQLENLKYLYESTELCEIMGRNGSDKGNKDLARSHNYTTVYYKLFKNLKQEPLNIFELGLGTNNVDVPSNMGQNGRPGASLYGWAEFFPKSKVYGGEIDKRVLFNTERIKTFYCDQTNAEVISEMWNNDTLRNLEFDIIIEDGLHQHKAQICFFRNSIHKLKPGGYYIIEDFNHGRAFDQMCRTFDDYFVNNLYPNISVDIYQLPATSQHHKSNGNNSLVIIKKND